MGLTGNPYPDRLVGVMGRSIHAYVVEELKHADLDAVSTATKISVSTLRKIRGGHIENPGIKGMETLYFHFKDREGAVLRRRRAA